MAEILFSVSEIMQYTSSKAGVAPINVSHDRCLKAKRSSSHAFEPLMSLAVLTFLVVTRPRMMSLNIPLLTTHTHVSITIYRKLFTKQPFCLLFETRRRNRQCPHHGKLPSSHWRASQVSNFPTTAFPIRSLHWLDY